MQPPPNHPPHQHPHYPQQQMYPPQHHQQQIYPQPQPPPKKKTNPALLALGIGCGSLFLLAAIGGLIGAFWIKSKVSDAVGGIEQFAKQEEEIQALNAKYPFTPPAEGKQLRLDEKRVQDYLAIRASVVPIFTALEKESKKLDDKDQGIGTGLKAIGMTGAFFRDVRAKYAEELANKRMSPAEFHSITGAIYSSYIGKGVADLKEGQRKALEESVANLDKAIASANKQMRPILEKQRDEMKEQLAKLPKTAIDPQQKAIIDANLALLEKYKDRIEKEANPALDVFLFGDASGIENAFKPLQQLGE